MRKTLIRLALTGALLGLHGLSGALTAGGASACKTPFDTLAEKTTRVFIAGGRAGKWRAELARNIGKATAAWREDKFCEAADSLEVFKFNVSRLAALGLINTAPRRAVTAAELHAAADGVAGRMKQVADLSGVDCRTD